MIIIMYRAYRIQPDNMENRERYYYYENSEDFEPMWLKYVYSVCLFSMVVLFVVIIV